MLPRRALLLLHTLRTPAPAPAGASLLARAPLGAHSVANIQLQRFFTQSPLLLGRRDRASSAPAPTAAPVVAPQAGDWRAAVAEFERQQNPPTPSAVHDLVELCAQSGRHREAQDVVRRAQQLGVVVEVRSHALLCAAVATKRGADRALAMLAELQRERGAGLSVDVYDPLLSVLKAQGDWRAAHAAIQQMHRFGLQPPLRAFRVLMLAAAKARQTSTLLATVAFVETQFPGARRDSVTLTAICQALVAVDETARVRKIYDESDRAWLAAHANAMLFNNFLLAAVKHDRALDRAMTIFEQMKRSASGHPDDFTYATLMLELEKRGEWDRVLELFNDMQEREARSAPGTKPLANALTCAVVIRALHRRQERSDGPEASRQDAGSESRALKRDLGVVLKTLPRVDVANLGHASSLVDALDEFRLYTAARQVFMRLLSERVIDEDAWMRHDGYEVDLHTFSLGVAKCAVVHAFEEFKRRHEHHLRTNNDEAQDLRIVTGVGRHSREYLRPKIRDEVMRMFAQSFRPPIWPATHPTNPGVIIVRSKVLRTWVRKDGVVRYF
ncbi:hypothetical protein PybrP1_005123 [[Pythium] brassicae (nom. inval.)]|nr:hypothetical protein PybrP1_005123 [[Pythium] brassicae (nom. inval.)]